MSASPACRELRRTYELDGLLGHIVNDDKVDFADIEPFFADGSGDKDIVRALLEIGNGLSHRVS